MALSDLDTQLLLVQQVGDVDAASGDPVLPTTQGSTGIVMQNIGRLWAAYADKGGISQRLRALYVMRDAHDLAIGVLERLVDFSALDGTYRVSLSQRVKARQQQRADIVIEINKIERQLLAAAGPVVGLLSTSAPISPPQPGERPQVSINGPDANSPIYTGSPYWRRGRAPW